MLVASYPYSRLRRLRSSDAVIELFRENNLQAKDLIAPIFVRENESAKDIDGMPGVCRFLINELPKVVEELYSLGIRCVMLFPRTPDNLKNYTANEAFNPNNLICRAIKVIKSNIPEMLVMSDVALDPYTDHGHDGICDENGYVVNDVTVEALVKQSLNQINAGADGVCPSDMMDGRIMAIRKAFEDKDLVNALIISYSVKYASSFYGPFRNAIGTKLQGDKKSYQLDSANSRQAIQEVMQDIQEGADAIIIKPGLPYLDIVKSAAGLNSCPVWVYQVSGEYSAIKFAAQGGAINEKNAFLETCISFKRAGANSIITYAAKDIAMWIRDY